MTNRPRVWTAKDVANYTRLSIETVRRLTNRGEVPAWRDPVLNLFRYTPHRVAGWWKEYQEERLLDGPSKRRGEK